MFCESVVFEAEVKTTTPCRPLGDVSQASYRHVQGTPAFAKATWHRFPIIS